MSNNILIDVPQVLSDSYNNKANVFGKIIFPEKLLLLISNNNSDKIWEKIINMNINKNIFIDNDCACLSFYHCIEVAFSGLSTWQEKTKSDRKERCLDITKKAKELAKLLKETPFDNALLTEFDSLGYYQYMLDHFKDEQREYFRNLTKTGYLEYSLNTAEANGEITNKHEIMLNTIGLVAPSYSEALIGLAKKAEIKSKKAGEIVSKKFDSAKVVYFIRILTDWLKYYFNATDHELVSWIAQIIFHDESFHIRSQEVRDALKRYKNRPPPTQSTKNSDIYLKKIIQGQTH